MPGLASIFRRPLFRRTQLFRASGSAVSNAPAIPSVESPSSTARANESDDAATREHSTRTEAERLERVAAYARAGYFNLGYTYEMFHLAGELPPPD
jgi:hypothetical protein